MRLIRKGNDIGVVWSIFANQGGSVVEYSLQDRNISLFLETGKNKYEIKDFTIVGDHYNSVKFTFWGKDQIACGAYFLTMVENKGEEDMRVLDFKDAFAIVRHSWETGGSDNPHITTEVVELSTNIGDIIDERLIPDTIARRTDFADYLPLDGSSTMTGALDMGSHKITNVTTPTSDYDAANKKYVDDGIAALDGTITLASPSSTVTPNAAQNAGTVIPVVSSFTLKERDGKLIEKGSGTTDSKVGTTYVDAGGSALKALNDAKSYADTKDAEINAKISTDASSSNKVMDKAYIDGKDAAINAKIPSAASSSNQLADKAWVKAVNDLVNYYKKSETYTQAEVNALIGSIEHFHYEIVTTLPATGKSNVLYLLGPKSGTSGDMYEEYVYSNGWVKIGDTSIDLSGYMPKSGGTFTGDVNIGDDDSADLSVKGNIYVEGGEILMTDDPTSEMAAINKGYVDDGLSGKQDTLVSGTNIKTINSTSLLGSGDIQISADTSDCVKITSQSFTDAQKAQARANIGAIDSASKDYAQNNPTNGEYIKNRPGGFDLPISGSYYDTMGSFSDPGDGYFIISDSDLPQTDRSTLLTLLYTGYEIPVIVNYVDDPMGSVMKYVQNDDIIIIPNPDPDTLSSFTDLELNYYDIPGFYEDDMNYYVAVQFLSKYIPKELPSGGTTGQVLTKASGTNYDVEWANGGGGDTSDCVKYTQQSKTDNEKTTARTNIGITLHDDVIDVTPDPPIAVSYGKMGIISQTQTWTQAADGGYDYTIAPASIVRGIIPQANIDLFVAAGAVFNETSGYFELNGLTDISYNEMKAIYTHSNNWWSMLLSGMFESPLSLRTAIPPSPNKHLYAKQGATTSLAFYFADHSDFEVFPYGGVDKGNAFQQSNITYLFNDSHYLKKVTGFINLTNVASAPLRPFANCYSLETLSIANLKVNISFANSQRLSKSSLLYMINNAGTNTITITLHASVYAKCQSGGEWYSDISTALAAHTNVSLASA